MKKLLVIAIVGMMVMGLTLAANAAATDDVWAVYLKGTDQAGGNALASSTVLGASGTVESDSSASAGVGSAQVALTTFDPGVGTGSTGYSKEMHPAGTSVNAYNLKLWALPECTATSFIVTGWNPSGTYALGNGGATGIPEQTHLIVVSCPAGITLTDTSGGADVQVTNPVGYEFTFATGKNGTSTAPQLDWTFNGATAVTAGSSSPILLELVPEPGSILAMLSGLVGLVGFGIRRRK